jgi:SsrA-binding protein
MAKSSAPADRRHAAVNRRARFDFFISDTVEAGLMLAGSEVKSLRAGHSTLTDSYAGPSNGEIFLFNAHIPEYRNASHFNHEARRPRTLLLKRREIAKLIDHTQKKGVTLVPLSIYFNDRGRAKVELGVATGKKQHDKRDAQRDRDWKRDKARIMRENTKAGDETK